MRYPPQGAGGSLGSTVEVSEIESLADGSIIVGDGSGAPTTLAAFSSATGRLITAVTLPVGAVGTPSLAFSGELDTGIYWFGADSIGVATAGALRLTIATAAVTSTVPVVSKSSSTAAFSVNDGSDNRVVAIHNYFGGIPIGLALGSTSSVGWGSTINAGADSDLSIYRLAAASLRLGKVPSASPIAQTFTIGEASRPATDTNIAGASGVLRSGLGTGTGTPATLSLQGPVVAASGTDTQTYATMIQLTGTKVGMYGKTPVVQAATITVDGGGAVACVASGATSLQVKLDAVIVALTNLGILT